MIDNHIHIWNMDDDLDAICADFDSVGIDKAVIVCVSNANDASVNHNVPGLRAKIAHPDRFYLFPGCDYSHAYDAYRHEQSLSFSEQVARYAEIGADGWKMLEGKPGSHKQPLDSPFYEDLFQALTDHKLPLLIHVGDPVEFWNPDTLPQWAMPDWGYDETSPTLDSLRNETYGMLKAFPDMTVILAHSFFMGYELDRAREVLDTYPNAVFDLAPGVEMFFGYSQDLDASRAFFTDYQDRILFGTDRGVAEMPAAHRSDMITRFLSTEDSFDPPHDDIVMWPDDRAPIVGLGLSPAIVTKITRSNVERLVGNEPKPINTSAVVAELDRLTAVYANDIRAAELKATLV
jgi:predicted TIM-barrel fold metal-dependent hydrolase